MMKRLIPVLALGLGLGLALPGDADDSLAAVAQREKERRAKLKGSARVIGDEDLQTSGVAAPAEATGSAGSSEAGKPGPAAEKTADEQRSEARERIQKEIGQQTEHVRTLRQEADQIQAQLNDLSGYTVGPGRASLMEALDKRNQAIAESERRIAALQEEARRLGLDVSRP